MPFNKFITNNVYIKQPNILISWLWVSDDISFVYAYAVFKDSHYKHNAYSHSTPTYAYNTYTQERVNALSQGFSSLASDVSTHNIVVSDSDISHCFDTLLYRELESLYKDYMAYTPIALDNGYKIGNIKHNN